MSDEAQRNTLGAAAAADLADSKRARAQATRSWMLPFLVLGAVVFLLVLLGELSDSRRGLAAAWARPHPEAVAPVLGNVAQVVAQVLGVAISVVAIIVELAANRYTHRITELFFRAPVNFTVMGLYVVSALQPMWVAFSGDPQGLPHLGTLLSMILMTLSVLSLLPYFAYVAAFVSPLNIIRRLRHEAIRTVEKGPSRDTREEVERMQHASAESGEQLSDVALNAMVHHDKAIAMAAINAVGDLLRDYLDVKDRLPKTWFQMGAEVRQNPDFVSLAVVALEEIEQSRTWYEFKLLRQYEMIYRQALNSHRELNYLIASNVRDLACLAMDRDDTPVVDLAVKFFNTFMRATLNARDIRTAYNVLNQYRQVAEYALGKKDRGKVAVAVARHFKYYGLLAFNMDLGFVLETAAYDLCSINEKAFDLNAKERPDLLRVFLQVDKEGEGEKKEVALRGVRKAQVKLAAYYLHNRDEKAAKEVFRDMANENPSRLASIRDELLAVDSPYYWEVTDRGSNFDWMPPERRGRVMEFFEWFGDHLPSPRASIVIPMLTPVPGTISPAQEAEAETMVRDPGAATEEPTQTNRQRAHTAEPAPRPVDNE